MMVFYDLSPTSQISLTLCAQKQTGICENTMVDFLKSRTGSVSQPKRFFARTFSSIGPRAVNLH